MNRYQTPDRRSDGGADIVNRAEEIFARRMLPHFLAGKSPEDAARAVLDDDARLLNAASTNRGQAFFSDTVGAHMVDTNPVAGGIATAITAEVYRRLRA